MMDYTILQMFPSFIAVLRLNEAVVLYENKDVKRPTKIKFRTG